MGERVVGDRNGRQNASLLQLALQEGAFVDDSVLHVQSTVLSVQHVLAVHVNEGSAGHHQILVRVFALNSALQHNPIGKSNEQSSRLDASTRVEQRSFDQLVLLEGAFDGETAVAVNPAVRSVEHSTVVDDNALAPRHECVESLVEEEGDRVVFVDHFGVACARGLRVGRAVELEEVPLHVAGRRSGLLLEQL